MKFLKENKNMTKWVVIVLVVLLILFIINIFILPIFGGDPYGDRLDGIKEVRINNDSITRMKQEISSDTKVESVNYDLKGKIINIEIKVATNTVKDDAKKIADKILEYFSKSQKEYYDIQVYLLSDEANKGYPYIGYKHKTAKSFMWTNN